MYGHLCTSVLEILKFIQNQSSDLNMGLLFNWNQKFFAQIDFNHFSALFYDNFDYAVNNVVSCFLKKIIQSQDIKKKYRKKALNSFNHVNNWVLG